MVWAPQAHFPVLARFALPIQRGLIFHSQPLLTSLTPLCIAFLGFSIETAVLKRVMGSSISPVGLDGSRYRYLTVKHRLLLLGPSATVVVYIYLFSDKSYPRFTIPDQTLRIRRVSHYAKSLCLIH